MRVTKSDIQKSIIKECNELVWTDGSAGVYYYHNPNRISWTPECAIRVNGTLAKNEKDKSYFVWWNGFRQAVMSDLDALKNHVEEEVKTKKLSDLDLPPNINLLCNVCGESKSYKEIGIIYGTHTCTECADNMGEECRELGLQSI